MIGAMMDRALGRWGRPLWVLLGLACCGCEEDYCDGCGEPPPEVVMEAAYPYRVEVHVADPAGFAVAGADVELIVATAPEWRVFGRTAYDGAAWFEVDAPPGVALVAYVSAPGFESNAGDIGTYAGAQVLHIPVCLYPAYGSP